jgi:hypothetical protein
MIGSLLHLFVAAGGWLGFLFLKVQLNGKNGGSLGAVFGPIMHHDRQLIIRQLMARPMLEGDRWALVPSAWMTTVRCMVSVLFLGVYEN